MRLQYGQISLVCEDNGSLKRALKLISLQEGSRASRSAWQESEKAKQMKDTFSRKLSGSLANWDSRLSFWKMSQGLFQSMKVEPLARYSGRWPKWGIILNGVMYRQHNPEHPTRETGSGLWPTARTRGLLGGSGSREMLRSKVKAGEILEEEATNIAGVAMWPTPTGTERSEINPETGKGVGLSKTVKQWPTPRESEWKGCGPLDSKSHNHRLDRQYLDAMVQDAEQASGSLNPDWVEWLMGFDIGFSDIECAEPQEHPGWGDDPAEIFPTIAASRRGPHTHREIIGDRQVKAHKSGASAGMTLETYTTHHPQGNENIPRLTTIKENRVNRLKALGNAVVPQQARLALELLING